MKFENEILSLNKSYIIQKHDTLVFKAFKLYVSEIKILYSDNTVYSKTDKGFYIKAPVDLPNGMKFTLEETIGKESFEVMELLEKGGKSLTPYTSPIIYERIK